jgi:hypothetical protein
MPWGAQQWLRITKESTYGVRGAGAVAWVRLYQANPFTVRAVPQRQVIRSADASNRRRQVVAARKVYTGSMNTLFYPSQASFFLTAATTIGDTYTNDLDSYTIDYYDSTRTNFGLLGCKISQLTLSSSATQDYVPMSINWTAQQLDTTTVLSQPVDGNFPSEVPYEHTETAGQITVAGSTLTKYSSATVTINNVLAPTWDEQPYITNLYYAGRDVDYSIAAQYISSSFRTAFEAQTALTNILKWNRTGSGNSVTLTVNTKNYIGSIQDQIPLDGPAYQTIGFQCFYDTGSSTDMTVTVV